MGNATRLRVLQIGKFYPPHMGGMETHLQALCGALSKRADVRVLVANHGRPTQRNVVDGIPVTRSGTKAIIASAPVCPSMPWQVRASDADLVHIHLPNPTAVLSYLAGGNVRRIVVTYHSDTIKQKRLYSVFKPFQDRLLARCSAIIATSSKYIETSAVLREHRQRCHVVPYGIPVDHFRQPDIHSLSRIRNEHGARIILAVGRLVYYKGFEYLIRAMSKVKGRLLLIGDGPLRSNLETLAINCGVSDRVIFLGDIKNNALLPFYHAAELFVLPSIARSEAFGIVQLEAMAAGKPVINTQLASGVPTVSLHGVTGLTVPPANPDALAESINLLLEDPDMRLDYGRAARLRAISEFNVETMASKTLEVYGRVMAEWSADVPNRLVHRAAAGD